MILAEATSRVPTYASTLADVQAAGTVTVATPMARSDVLPVWLYWVLFPESCWPGLLLGATFCDPASTTLSRIAAAGAPNPSLR